MSRKEKLLRGASAIYDDASDTMADVSETLSVFGKEISDAFTVTTPVKPKSPAPKPAPKPPVKPKSSAKTPPVTLAVRETPDATALALKKFNVTQRQLAADKARKAAARAAGNKNAAIRPNPNPNPDLAEVEFPQGAGLGGAYAIENNIPIVGRKPSLAQSSSGYSGLSASVPADRVVADVTETEMIDRIMRTPAEVAENFAAGIPLIGDALINGRIRNVNGRPQVGSTLAEGGPNYPRDMSSRGDPSAWASIGSVISNINNRRAYGEELFDGPVAGVYTRMGNTAVDQTTAMMEVLGRQLAAGGVTNANLKILDGRVKTIMGEDFSKSFVGFEKDALKAAAQLNNINVVRMPQRTAIIKSLDSSNAMMAGFPDIGANRVAVTVPDLLYAPEGSSGYMISSLLDNAGRRAGSNTPNIEHPNYPKKQSGEYFGGLADSVPRELMFPDYAKAMYGSGYEPAQVHSYLFSRTPSEIKDAFGRDPLIQRFDQEWVDTNSKYLEAIKNYGPDPYARGGLAVKPRRERSSAPRSLAVRNRNKEASKVRRAGS